MSVSDGQGIRIEIWNLGKGGNRHTGGKIDDAGIKIMEDTFSHEMGSSSRIVQLNQQEKLSKAKQADLEIILGENPKFRPWYALSQRFMIMMRDRERAALDIWLEAQNDWPSNA